MNFDELKAMPGLHIALFYGAACAPCERLKPEIRAVCRDAGLHLEEFNAAGEMEVLRELNIRSVPAVLVVKDGEARLAFTGALDTGAIASKLRMKGVEI